MSASISGGGFYFELNSVGGKWSWKVVADNITNLGQLFYVSDIKSPFGPLYDVNSPIPGDVVLAMSDSLNTFKTQLSATLALVSSSSVTLTVSEGDTIYDAGLINFTNSGALGSFLSAAATSSQPWLSANPASILGINKNQVASTRVHVNPGIMISASSPYTGVVNLQNLDSPLSVIPVVFTVNVLPRPSILLDQSNVYFTYNISSNTLSGPIIIGISNDGPLTSILNGYISKVQNRSPWLNLTLNSFGPLDSGDSTSFTMSLNTSGITKIPGTYTETISVSSINATNSPALINVRLTVT